MERVRVEVAGGYDVCIGPGLIRETGKRLAAVMRPCQAAVITDDTVAALYGDAVVSGLREAGFAADLWAFPHGEAHKTLSTLAGALEWMGERRLSRGDVVVALGGGVPGDLAGFAAAVYGRGVPFAQLPTTLLSAVDSSVGGKTAVDLRAGKNLAGAFHQPGLVLCDTDILGALPPELMRDGAAEMLKYGLLADAALFDRMASGAWKAQLAQTVARCVAIKRDYVQRDERDTGERQFLNLGHTFGHAAELCSGFTLTHGQGVGVGLVMAARASGMDAAAVAAAVSACGLPVSVPYSAAQLAQAALSDKKRRGGRMTLVLPRAIGRCELRTLPVEELPAVFARATGETP